MQGNALCPKTSFSPPAQASPPRAWLEPHHGLPCCSHASGGFRAPTGAMPGRLMASWSHAALEEGSRVTGGPPRQHREGETATLGPGPDSHGPPTTMSPAQPGGRAPCDGRSFGATGWEAGQPISPKGLLENQPKPC